MYSLIKQNDDITYNLREYVCDTEEDIASLPRNCAPGSSAFVLATSTFQFLNSFQVWELVAGGGQGIDPSEKGAPNGVASLDENGKVPVIQLPQMLRYYGPMTQAEYDAIEEKDSTAIYLII